jgi:hypothetical protein
MDGSTYRQLSKAVDRGADLRDGLDQWSAPPAKGPQLEPLRALVANVHEWSSLVGAQMPEVDLEHDSPRAIKDRLLAFLDRQIPVVHKQRLGA